jgi:IS30 family transposase
MEYCHPSSCEQSQIYALLSNKCFPRQIVFNLNKSLSTIGRDIKRNTKVEATGLNKPKPKQNIYWQGALLKNAWQLLALAKKLKS